jgi:hypothetical protein
MVMVLQQIMQLLKVRFLSKDYTSIIRLSHPKSGLSLRGCFGLFLEASSMLFAFYWNFAILIYSRRCLREVLLWWTTHHIIYSFNQFTFFTNFTYFIHQYQPMFIYLFNCVILCYSLFIIFLLYLCLCHYFKFWLHRF